MSSLRVRVTGQSSHLGHSLLSESHWEPSEQLLLVEAPRSPFVVMLTCNIKASRPQCPLKAESPRFCDTIRSLLPPSRSQRQMKRKSPAMGGTVKLGEAPRCIKGPCFQIKRPEQKAGRRKGSWGSCCLAHLHSLGANLAGQPLLLLA